MKLSFNIALIAAVLSISSSLFAWDPESDDEGLPNETPETLDVPPRKRACEAEFLFGCVTLQNQGPPIKRWAEADEDDEPANSNHPDQRETGESDDEVIRPSQTKSRTSTEDGSKPVTRYVGSLIAQAQGGSGEAKFKLAKIYLAGAQGEDVDLDRGMAFLVDAAMNGYLGAQEYLGRAHEEGLHGLEVNDEEAANWYEQAARNGRGLKRAREGLKRIRQRQAERGLEAPTPAPPLAMAVAVAAPPEPAGLEWQVATEPRRQLVLILRRVAATPTMTSGNW